MTSPTINTFLRNLTGYIPHLANLKAGQAQTLPSILFLTSVTSSHIYHIQVI